MDWETLLGVAGTYILLLAVVYYLRLISKKIDMK